MLLLGYAANCLARVPADTPDFSADLMKNEQIWKETEDLEGVETLPFLSVNTPPPPKKNDMQSRPFLWLHPSPFVDQCIYISNERLQLLPLKIFLDPPVKSRNIRLKAVFELGFWEPNEIINGRLLMYIYFQLFSPLIWSHIAPYPSP